MKKILMLLMAITLCLPMSAQNSENDGKPYYFYCQIVGNLNLAGKLRLNILWNNQDYENDIRTEKGEKVEFKNMVEAINYMSKRGWEYVESTYYANVIHYLFRKLVKSDEEAKKGLYFKSDFKK